MMEYLELLDFIEEKVTRLNNGEETLRDEIIEILLSDKFVKGPLLNEKGKEVYEMIYFLKDGKPEQYLCGLYKGKLKSLLRRNKEGELVYNNYEIGRASCRERV